MVLEAGSSLWRDVRVATSYCSSNDPRVLVGLGSRGSIQEVRVHHPDGAVESWQELPLRRYHVLRKGSGQKVQ